MPRESEVVVLSDSADYLSSQIRALLRCRVDTQSKIDTLSYLVKQLTRAMCKPDNRPRKIWNMENLFYVSTRSKARRCIARYYDKLRGDKNEQSYRQ